MNVVDIISKLPVLQEIDRGQAEEIAAHFSEARYAAGAVLHREQERRELLIIIQEGTVEIRKQLGAKPEAPLITYGPGDVLAEAVLLEDTEHSTSAVARTPVTALVAPGDKLRAIMDEDLPLKAHIKIKTENGRKISHCRVYIRSLLAGRNIGPVPTFNVCIVGAKKQMLA